MVENTTHFSFVNLEPNLFSDELNANLYLVTMTGDKVLPCPRGSSKKRHLAKRQVHGFDSHIALENNADSLALVPPVLGH